MKYRANSYLCIVRDRAALGSTKNRLRLRFVDFPIGRIQSGLTPRAQVRAVAQTLRLQRSAAKFVFNRVLIRKARSAPSRLVRDLEPCLHLPHVSPLTRPSESRLHETAQELSVVTKPGPVKPPDSAVSADASHPSAAAQPSLTAVSPHDSPAGAAPHEPGPSARVARGRGNPQRNPSASTTPRSPLSPPPASVIPAADHLPSPPAPAPAPPDNPELPASYLSAPSSAFSALHPPDPEPDDLASELTPYPPSRLSGLRNLLVSLGRRSLNQEHETADAPHPDIEPRFERATLHPAYQDSALSADSAPERSASTHLTARPEFLPPRPGAETENSKEKEAVRPAPSRRETPEGDEIQTLPSWRGQYRKKRYPPI